MPATPATRYRADYVERLCTEILLFQLIEAGKVSLQTPLDTFFPQLPRAHEVTIDDLRAQRSGWPGSLRYDPSRPLTQPQALARLATANTGRELWPGQYAVATDYLLLRYVVEQLTGQPYAQVLRQRLAAKAGLTHTYFTTELRPGRQEALSYEWRGSGWETAPRSGAGLDGNGTLVSTPTDLSGLLAALYGGQLVSAASRTAMLPGGNGMPRVLAATTLDGTPLYSCSGSLDGIRSGTYYFPQSRLAVCLLLNGLNASYNEVLLDILHASLGQPYRQPTAVRRFVPDPADLARCLGSYRSPELLRCTVARDGPTLRLESAREGNTTLVPVRPGEFRTRNGSRVQFSPGRQQFRLSGGAGAYVFTRR